MICISLLRQCENVPIAQQIQFALNSDRHRQERTRICIFLWKLRRRKNNAIALLKLNRCLVWLLFS